MIAQTVRYSVWLPATTPQHYSACEEALGFLFGLFGGNCSIAWDSPWRPGNRLVGRPCWHGCWIDTVSTKPDYDSHLIVVSHQQDTRECSATHRMLSYVEREVHRIYLKHRRGGPKVYQKEIFVEATLGEVLLVDDTQKQMTLPLEANEQGNG